MNLADLHDCHRGQPIYCLGTAPHLDHLDLARLRDRITIGCSQLLLRAEEFDLKYACFGYPQRFTELRDAIPAHPRPVLLASDDVLAQQGRWRVPAAVRRRLVEVPVRFTTPGHAEFFSFDLNDCAYAADTLALAIQFAVWMGGDPIYLLGVDAAYRSDDQVFYASSPKLQVDVEAGRKYWFPDLVAWLGKVQHLLAGRGVRLLNGAGEASSLAALPRLRYAAALGDPLIAVTSKTFCNDAYLVDQLRRYFPRCKLNPSEGKLAGAELAAFLADADAMILGTEPLSGDVIAQLPYLRHVAKYGVGLDNVDFTAARQHSVEVSYRKGVNSDSVAELALALCLMLLRRVDESVQGYRQGQWRKLPGQELAELTLGVVGYGHVGRVVARKFAALGVGRLLVNDLVEITPEQPAESVPFDYLIAHSDIVSFHISMEPQNHHLVNAGLLARLKPGAYLLNTSRGEVVDEAALAAALQSGHLGGAALDVYEHEPRPNPALAACPRLLTTCHMAGSSNRAIKAMGWAAIEGLLAAFGKEAN